MEGLNEHLRALVDRNDSREESEAKEVEEAELLNVAIHAAVDLTSEQPAESLPAPEGIRYLSQESIWHDILAAETSQTHEPVQAELHEESAVTKRLRQHALSTYGSDSALFESAMASVASSLTKKGTSDEEMSIVLAEMLGFEHLDLVEAIVKNKADVQKDLTFSAKNDARTERIGNHDSASSQPKVSNTSIRARIQDDPVYTNASSSSKPYTPGSSVVVHTREEIEQNKKRRAEERRLQRARAHHHHDVEDDGQAHLTEEEMAILRAQSLQAAAERPLFSSDRVSSSEPQYPHVFASNAGGNILSAFGTRFSLPAGTSRLDHDFYEEVTIPPPRQLPMRSTERLIPIAEMDPLARGAFPGYKSLNRLQSVVYPLGYGSNENLLVCAPTGAGKTDVAMLTVLRAIKMHARSPEASNLVNEGLNGTNSFGIRYDDFKIIYVAPMKALASEIVGKFSKRLRYLGVKVRELTGDMQMTRKEIDETQMIVTTPEKWDVVTRKPTGEGELASKVKLLIIDEVHLLHEGRGAVIETIVARTLRLVESSQSLIRIVGLSATLPNYVDVADFLRVNRYQGLFFFDSSFRPVPLEQHFLGIKGKANSPTARQRMDKATFEKLQDLVSQGHQVMIFVHARKETVKTAYGMRDLCRDEGVLDHIKEAREDAHPDAFRREIIDSRNRELKELFETGFGIHHAGMLRKDRNLSERLFEAGVTRVLCCTSTLAWGVNLPAYAVLIKGTDIYDSSLGRFSDLSILDVLQIFGRAGRPQYEKVGVGYIVTSHDKLSHYVDAITSQHPIESHFKTGMIDALNAECALGSVNSITDGVTWLSYTYMFTRMRRNPLQYGMLADEVADDPQLGAKRLHEITSAAKYLKQCKMLDVDQVTGQLTITELGRIAARYYITYKTIEVFNEKLRNNMTEADLLSVFGQATDFEQITPRENELQELKKLEERVPCEISGACDTSAGKTNLLLQAFISRLYIDDFALVSDSGYVAQNAGRVMRAIFETSLSKHWAGTSAAALGLARSIERRLWPFDHPLAQSNLRPDMVHQLSQWADELEVKDLAMMQKEDIATMCKVNARHADVIRQAAKRFPHLTIESKLRPLTFDLLRIDLAIKREYEWDPNRGSVDAFYIWIEDEKGDEILQSKRIIFHSNSAGTQMVQFIVDHVAISHAFGGVSVRWISEQWLGAEDVVYIPFDTLRLADPPQASTELLDLPLLQAAQSFSSLGFGGEVMVEKMTTLNALQTQVLSAFIDVPSNVICAMPHRAGRTTLVNAALFRSIQLANSSGLMLIVHPNFTLAQQSFADLKAMVIGVSVTLARNAEDILRAGKERNNFQIIYTISSVVEDALHVSSEWTGAVKLVAIEDLHLLDARAELAISFLRRSMVMVDARWIVTSASLYHIESMQAWLDVRPDCCFNFGVKDRPTPLRSTVVSFDLPHSLHLLKSMIKPAYDRLKQSIATHGQGIVFVPSRAQAVSVARDLVRQAASEMDLTAFLNRNAANGGLEPYLVSLRDKSLHEILLAGVGVVTDGMAPNDRKMTLALYTSNVIRTLVVSRDACWSLPKVYCRCVVIMTTQFMRVDEAQVQMEIVLRSGRKAGHARLVDYPMSDIARMQSFAAAPQPIEGDEVSNSLGPNECFIFCQGDQALMLQRMLEAGVLVESKVLEDDLRDRATLLLFVLRSIVGAEVKSLANLVKALEWTFASHRMRSNPCYYDALSENNADIRARLEEVAAQTVGTLTSWQCVVAEEENRLRPTQFGSSIVGRNRMSLMLIVRLLAFQQRYADEPDEVARLLLQSSTVRSFSLKMIEQLSLSAIRNNLDATRQCTPGELLRRFNVPRIARKADESKGKEIEGGEDGGQNHDDGTMESLTEMQVKGLLLSLFCSFGQFTIRTPNEAVRIKAKSVAKSTSAGEEARRSNDAGLTAQSQRAEKECDAGKEALVQAMYSLVLLVLLDHDEHNGSE